MFAWVIGLGFVFSFVCAHPLIFVPFVFNSVIWTFLGFLPDCNRLLAGCAGNSATHRRVSSTMAST